MSVDTHLNDLQAYDEAVQTLYGEPLEARLASSAEAAPSPAADEKRINKVLEASRALTKTTPSLLDAEDHRVRETGVARLAALAARDMAIAYDIAQLEGGERSSIASAEAPGSALQAIEREVAVVLRGNPAEGIPVLANRWEGRAQLSGADTDPRESLRESLPTAIEHVRDDATTLVITGVGKLIGAQLDDALNKLASGLLDALPNKVKKWYRWALDMFKEGIRKLLHLFGETFEKAVQAIRDWLVKHSATVLADSVYGVPLLRDEVRGFVDDASDDKDWPSIATDVKAVVDKFATIKTVVLAVFKVIGLARNWLLRLLGGAPGEAAVSGALVLGTAYGLFAGGDFVDWHRTKDDGAFDFVRGVRRTAQAALASG
jgi:hypothetical protein